MQVRITNPKGYMAAANGFTVVNYPFGSIVNGNVAAWAIEDKAGEFVLQPELENKIVTVGEIKTKRKKKKG